MPRRKALKVIVDLHFHAITCPGVFLPDQQDVFLNVEMLGQRKRTKSAPPVFPFLFHEKLRFDKVFSHATDPVQIASALNGETVRIELVQLTYPAGELLATYEDNARDFLFPTPKVSPTYPGVDREVLLQRSSSFPGIAPKLEFSSRTIIKEVTAVGGGHSSKKQREKHFEVERESYHRQPISTYNQLNQAPIETSTPQVTSTNRSSSKKKTRSSASSSGRQGRSKARASSLSRATTQWGYEQSTIASRARSPSPYTRRRMAQLSVSDPFDSAVKNRPFKTDLEERPNFVIRKAANDSLSYNKTPPSLPHVSLSPERRRSLSRERSKSPSRRKQTPGPSKRFSTPRVDYDSDDTTELIDSTIPQHSRRAGSRPTSSRSRSPSPVTPRRDLSFTRADLGDDAPRSSKITPDSILFRAPLRERFTSAEPSPYEKIRDRVRDLLRSPRATQILDDSYAEASDRYWQRRSRTPSPRATPRSSVSVRLNDNEYWNDQMSQLTGKPHRRIFEESVDKIYDDIYKRVKNESP
ncbi:spermatogenesis-associated protein 6-like isoform X3 [Clavelina lepadiformis]|uniref:spermatogenesis-associated protein 6-like isoform X3 n=1 Tax=Clavelina lepadiformis TaxID=159417 RepID=UPI0040423B5D